jgi:hypothetical protein
VSTKHATSTTRRTAQAAVWLLLAAFVAVTAWSLLNPADSGGTNEVSYSLQAPDGTVTPLVAGTEGQLYAADSEVRAANYTGTTVSDQLTRGTKAGHWLPASRWDGVGLVSSKEGWFDPTAGMAAMAGGFLFTIAGIIWSWAFWILEKALSLDMVSAAAKQINDAAGALGAGLWESGALAVVVLFMILLVAGAVLRGQGNKGVRIVLGCIVPLAGLQLMLGSIATSSDSPNSAAYMFTPAGMSKEGSTVISEAVEKITTPMTSAQAKNQADSQNLGEENPCTYYYATLKNTYSKVAGEKNGFVSQSIVLLSDLWQLSFVDPLAVAQFGDVNEGRRGVCRHMEWEANTPVKEQAAVAGVTDKGSPYYGFATKATSKENKGPFTKVADRANANTSQLLWIACDYGTGKAGAAKLRANPWGKEWNKGGDNLDELCVQWSKGEWKGDGGLGSGDDPFEYKNGKDADKREFQNGTTGYKVIVHNLGHEGKGQRLTQGLGAVLSAVAYAGALTIPAFGCAIATAALALMLAILPLTLMLLAIPSKDGSNKGSGQKLLKLTGSLMLSKAMFLVLITILVQLILIFNAVLGVGR